MLKVKCMHKCFSGPKPGCLASHRIQGENPRGFSPSLSPEMAMGAPAAKSPSPDTSCIPWQCFPRAYMSECLKKFGNSLVRGAPGPRCLHARSAFPQNKSPHSQQIPTLGRSVLSPRLHRSELLMHCSSVPLSDMVTEQCIPIFPSLTLNISIFCLPLKSWLIRRLHVPCETGLLCRVCN